MIPVYEIRELIHRQRKADIDQPPSKSQRSESSEMSQATATPPHRVGDDQLYGIAVQFVSPEHLVKAVRRVRDKGYRKFDAFSPMPIPDLPQAMGLKHTAMPLIVLTGALVGAASAYLMQWYSAVIEYPWNIGGRPAHSWPSFIPLTFELGVLGGAIFGVLGLIILNRFPQPYHPMSNAPEFSRAQSDRFFLCIESDDPNFDREEAWQLCQEFESERVTEVPRSPHVVSPQEPEM